MHWAQPLGWGEQRPQSGPQATWGRWAGVLGAGSIGSLGRRVLEAESAGPAEHAQMELEAGAWPELQPLPSPPTCSPTSSPISWTLRLRVGAGVGVGGSHTRLGHKKWAKGWPYL